jgi:hypothetical protein
MGLTFERTLTEFVVIPTKDGKAVDGANRHPKTDGCNPLQT